MVGFGGKQAWLAVRNGDPAEVLAALGLRDLGDVPWRAGIDLAHLTDDRVAVTPPLSAPDGSTWVLAVGRFLLRPDTTVDVTDLSKRLQTEVQYFATHRVTETHRWQRADDGTLIRAFGYVGQTGDVTSWYGDPDAIERSTGLPPTFHRPDDLAPDALTFGPGGLDTLDADADAPDARGLDRGSPDESSPGVRRAQGDGTTRNNPSKPELEAPLNESMLTNLDDELTRLLTSANPSTAAEATQVPQGTAPDDEDRVTVLVSEHDVLRVAEGWSIDPTRLDGRTAPGPLRLGAAA